MKSIVITGGHHNSALVVAEKLVEHGFDIVWLGHKFSSRRNKNLSAEYLEVNSAKIKFLHLRAGKIGRDLPLSNIIDLPLGVIRAFLYLVKYKPSAVFSFGGYLGASVSFAALILRIPVFLHEQTVVAGKANRFVKRFAKRIYLTWPTSRKYYPGDNVKVVGLPLRPSFLSPKSAKLFTRNKPTILVAGGKQGSHFLNQLVRQSLNTLLTHYNLIHITGNSSVTEDYQQALESRNRVELDLRDYYQVHEYVDEARMGSYLYNCDLYIGRSGAHTTYELGFFGKRALLIPFTHTHLQEQRKNAEFLASSGNALVAKESEMNSDNLITFINQALAFKAKQVPLLPNNATERIVADLTKNLS